MANQASATIVYDFGKASSVCSRKQNSPDTQAKLDPPSPYQGDYGSVSDKRNTRTSYWQQDFQERDEMEYERLYFLDLLAVGSSFLKLPAGICWQKGLIGKLFAAEPRERAS